MLSIIIYNLIIIFQNKKQIFYILLEIDRPVDRPIDRPVIEIGRFLAWLAWIDDQPVSLTSCRFRADPFIASGAGRDITDTPTLTVDITVASIHVEKNV